MNEKLVKQRTEDALSILRDLGFPRQQLNERSALTLLALLNLKPEDPWENAGAPLRGITPMMEFFKEHYGKNYAPNSRETVRRKTIHQFLDAGLITINADDPLRAVNSDKTVYQIEESALALVRAFGLAEWGLSLGCYLASIGTLKQRYAQDRKMSRIPIVVSHGNTITLSPGGQNILVEQIIKEFCPRFMPGGRVLYIGDTDEKFKHFDHSSLSDIGLKLDKHGKMPDLVIEYTAKKWLVLIEAVTSHGPINPKRHGELKKLFELSKLPLVYVTAFLTRAAMVQYLPEISWETEVWVADAPSHLIHFNGERFLGPYQN